MQMKLEKINKGLGKGGGQGGVWQMSIFLRLPFIGWSKPRSDSTDLRIHKNTFEASPVSGMSSLYKCPTSLFISFHK